MVADISETKRATEDLLVAKWIHAPEEREGTKSSRPEGSKGPSPRIYFIADIHLNVFANIF